MHRTLERLDALASTLVPLAYLAGLFLGTAAYFTGLVADAGIAVGIGLACGSELHAFLQQRRARASWAEYRRILRAGGDVSEAREGLRVNVAILAALVLFQCFTACAFAAETWHTAPGFLPAWVQIGARGCIVPVFFLLSGFLVPLHQSPAAVLTAASDEILHVAVRRNVRHWRKRIAQVHRRGGDLAPLMTALLHDAGELDAARRTTLIADNLAEAEGRMGPGFWGRLFRRPALDPGSPVGALLAPASSDAPAPAIAYTTSQSEGEPDPDGPGDPPTRPRGSRPGSGPDRRHGSGRRDAVLMLPAPASSPGSPAPRAARAPRQRNTGRAMADTAAVRAVRMDVARAILARDPDISAEALADAIKAPKSVAIGIKRELLAERRGIEQGRAQAERGA